MTKHYTELVGGTGERIQFGPQNYFSGDLFAGSAPQLRIGVSVYELTQIGPLALTFRAPKHLQPGGVTAEIVELVQGETVLAVRDVLSPFEIEDGLWECRFSNESLDVEGLVSANDAALLGARIKVGARSKSSDVPSEYRAFCADVLNFLGDFRRQVSSGIDPMLRDVSVDELKALDMEVRGTFADDWRVVTIQGNQLCLPMKDDKAALAAVKAYTENVVTPEMCESPLWNRCYTKPMGYPGDFEIMNAFYDETIVGDTAYERFLGVLGLLSGGPVAHRKTRLVEELEALRRNHPDQSHFHMMSIGAGPARELKDFFDRGSALGSGYSFTLVDPEAKALNFAIESVYSSVKVDLPSVMVSGLNTSFMEMLRAGSAFRHIPLQDFIYSAGLTDYLSESLTVSLINKLFTFLKPGGTVLIGNINDAVDGMFWAAECVLDWTMHYRSLADMERIAEQLSGDVEISLDPSGSYYILKVTKLA